MDKQTTQLLVEPNPPETEAVTEENIYCEGGPTETLGHPRVYLTLNKETRSVDCPYCDKRFIHKEVL